MQTLKPFLGLLLVVISCGSSFAQSSAAFQSLIYPRSIASSGLGEQGVASSSVFEAMQHNPANLIYADGIEFSFFRNPWNLLHRSIPLTSVGVIGRLDNAGCFGLEYTYWNFGEYLLPTIGNPDGNGELFHFYERSLGGGYAVPLSTALAIGGQIRYVWLTYLEQPTPHQKTVDHFLFSAGISYKPEISSNRLSAGLSFMNFGTRIEYPSSVVINNGQPVNIVPSDPPPAQMNIGILGLVVTNDFFDLNLSFGAMKPFDKRSGPPYYEAQSSFKSLFNDWTDFPEDVTAQIGLGYLWHPIYLGGGVSFFQEMYVGYFSVGPKDGYNSFYTHGLKIGLEAYGVNATAGYAGRWHNNNAGSYYPWVFPWESFQFGLRTDIKVFGKGREEPTLKELLLETILSGGYSYGLVVGKMKETEIDGAKVSFSNNPFWSVEAAFYINVNSAILSSIQYSRMTKTTSLGALSAPFFPSQFVMDMGIESFSLESGFRYHPFEVFHPFFLQASLGVIRMNPVYEFTSPRYVYKAFDRVFIGCVVPVLNLGIVVMPKVGLTTIFMQEYRNGNRLGGYNQFEFGLNVGYKL